MLKHIKKVIKPSETATPSLLCPRSMLCPTIGDCSRINGRRLVLISIVFCCDLCSVFSGISTGAGVSRSGITRSVFCSAVGLVSSSSSITIGVSFPPIWIAGTSLFLYTISNNHFTGCLYLEAGLARLARLQARFYSPKQAKLNKNCGIRTKELFFS